MNIEEFVNSYLQEHRHDVLLNPHNGLIDFANTFKEQMLKDAVEGEIQMRYSGCLCAKTIRAINEDKFKLGDKVRIIVLKEEEE